MVRRESLRKITKLLTARKLELRKRLGMDLGDLGRDGTGDVVDVAFNSQGYDLSSKLAELEGKELAQVELALQRIKQGRYGICDMCEKKILVGRLNVVPHSIMCLKCQQQAERDENWIESHASLDWGNVRDSHEDRVVDMAALEYEAGR